MFISTIGAGLCFLGTATYARYLNLVPGASVSNIVANVSAIDLGNATIITDGNATDTLNNLIATNRSLSDALNQGYGYDGMNVSDAFTSPELQGSQESTSSMNARHIDANNKILESIKKHVEEKKDDILLDVPEAEKNQFLWLPLTLLLAVALFGHMGIRIIPWMLIGEVN